MSHSLLVLAAVLLDWRWREPPSAVHPVIWMGNYLKRVARWLPESPKAAFAGGVGAWFVGVFLFVVPAFVISLLLKLGGVFTLLGGVLFAWAAMGLFSFRMLVDEVEAVEAALGRSLEEGRQRVGYLVSRNTSQLSPSQVRMAALETLAENLSDSVISPWFWYMIGGLPAMALQRFANTADAMWGYRGPWEWKGKWAARADDVLNWIPARLTALLFWKPGMSWKNLRQQAGQTESPNAGWPMACLALRLGLRFEKTGHYVLHPEGREPTAADVHEGVRIVRRAGWVALSVVFALALLVEMGTR